MMNRNKLKLPSGKEVVILELLSPGCELYGLEMVNVSDNNLKRGTVYVYLNRMEDKGYITSREEERKPGQSGLPRRLYKISGLGQNVLAVWRTTQSAFDALPKFA